MQVCRSLLVLLNLLEYLAHALFGLLVESQIAIIVVVVAPSADTVLIPYISIIIELHIVDVEVLLEDLVKIGIVAIRTRMGGTIGVASLSTFK